MRCSAMAHKTPSFGPIATQTMAVSCISPKIQVQSSEELYDLPAEADRCHAGRDAFVGLRQAGLLS